MAPPVKDTPPASMAEPKSQKQQKHVQCSDADTQISDSGEEPLIRPTHQRTKRKYVGKDEAESRGILAEMRMLFKNFQTQQDKKLTTLQNKVELFPSELSAIHSDLNKGRAEIAEFIKTCGARIDQVENRVSVVENKVEDNSKNTAAVEDAVLQLRVQLNDREQELMLNDIEISGVPETSEERIVHMVMILSKNLGVDLDEKSIVYAQRAGPNKRENSDARPRYIIVRLVRRETRDQLLRAARVRRDLTCSSLDVGAEPDRRVFVNERLTRANRQLVGRTRELAKVHDWKYVWTKDGNILVRKDDDKKVLRIRAEKDINKFFGSSVV